MNLRPFEQKDIPLILEWMQDPDTNRYFRFDPDRVNEETVLRFVETAQTGVAVLCDIFALPFANTGVAPPGAIPETLPDLHLACVNDEDDYLGTVSLKQIDRGNRNAEYAVSFRARARGTGAAAFATQGILALAFTALGMERVYLNVLADNTRARAFYEKHGFVYEGTFRKHLILRDEPHDLCWYSVLKEEFEI